MFTLTFETGNDAFQDGNAEAEVTRIMERVADALAVRWPEQKPWEASGACFDTNGAKVGHWVLTMDAD